MRRLGSSALLRVLSTSFSLVPLRAVEAACNLHSRAEPVTVQPARSIMARTLSGVTSNQASIALQSLSGCHNALHASPPAVVSAGVVLAGQRRQQLVLICSLGNRSRPTTRRMSVTAVTAGRQSAGSSDDPSRQPKRSFTGQPVFSTPARDVLPIPYLEARQKMVADAPFELFKLVGVSFEGRQEVLKTIEPGGVVVFTKKPHPMDPHAVFVDTLSGESLGFVAAVETDYFKHPITFGRIKTIGPEATTSQLGAVVEVQPDVPGLTVDALPDDMLPLTHLRLVVTRAAWDCIRGQAYERDDYRCRITGGTGPDGLVQAAPLWDVDDEEGTITLVDIITLAEPVRVALQLQRLPNLAGLEDLRSQAIATLSAVNQWTPDETAEYLNHRQQLRSGRTEQGQNPAVGRPRWRVNLAWLAQHESPQWRQLRYTVRAALDGGGFLKEHMAGPQECNHCLSLALGKAEGERTVEEDELVSLLGEYYPIEEWK
mmetsp:Transcript_20561/g.61874  ORF Transcript_20561/g.61874 Transcript_20561/m.61874 type:complete len:486 (+) Transcript_20561:367-1824(+)